MSNDRFASTVRSASFALTLSSAMIDELLQIRVVSRLERKYPWYRERHTLNFGTPEELMLEFGRRPSIAALARRGLVDIHQVDLPASKCDVVKLTKAGRLMCHVLDEAGFTYELPDYLKVHRHPDDRWKVKPGPDGFDFEEPEQDRRDPADAEFLARPHG